MAKHLICGRIASLTSTLQSSRRMIINASRITAKINYKNIYQTSNDRHHTSRRSLLSSTAIVKSAGTEAPATEPAAAAPDVSKVDIRVGKIISIEKHPDADSLYVEQVDLGEPEGPRTIVSGLVAYVPLEDMQNRSVIVLANLKPRNMRGIKSNGMLLCASNAEHTAVEPLVPPEGAVIGERIFFGEGSNPDEQGEAANPNQLQKKKLWEAVQPLLKTGGDCRAGFEGQVMMTSAGAVTCKSLTGASIS
jgi:aminoacyl tRNA synthase complex-interacting multifunctional protein 1